MTADTQERPKLGGVVKPEARYALYPLESALKYHWREYRHLRSVNARAGDALPEIYRRHQVESRAVIKALMAIRRACRPMRIGGA